MLLLGACSGPWTEHDLTIASDAVGDSYDVRVIVPDAAPTGDWPVLVFQDGDYWPRHDGTLADALAGGAPPFVLVAVAYQGFHTGLTGGLSDETLDRRLRDITEVEIEDVPGTGGAMAFQGFLDDELLDAVEAELGLGLTAERSARATFGYSAFGLSVTHGLLGGSETYGGWCAGSASLRRFDAPIYAAEDDPAPGTLSGWARFTIGSEETEDAAALDELLGWLDDGDQPDLEITRDTFEGEDHAGAMKPAFEACLEEITARW